MKNKILTALLLFSVVFTFLTGCKNNNAPAVTTDPTQEATQSYNEYTSVPQEAEPTTLSPLEFNRAEAKEIGTFESEIYGALSVYFQEDRLFLFDSFGTKRFELYAFSYVPEYEGSPIELTGDDVDFDGYTDFYLLYSKGNLNTYYCFWIWNMAERTFEYYLPLSSVPSPEIDKETKRIVSSDQISADTVISTEYIWNNGEIVPVANSEKKYNLNDLTEPASGSGTADETDSSVAIIDGMLLSSVMMTERSGSDRRWMCRVEDEGIVKLSSNTLDRLSGTRTFIFRGLRQGTTTVVLRFAENWDDEYAPQRILNITVNGNYTLKIVVVE